MHRLFLDPLQRKDLQGDKRDPEGIPDRVGAMEDRLFMPEIPLYPLEGQPVQFHGKRGMEGKLP